MLTLPPNDFICLLLLLHLVQSVSNPAYLPDGTQLYECLVIPQFYRMDGGEGGGVGGRAKIICNMDNLWFIGDNSLLRKRNDTSNVMVVIFCRGLLTQVFVFSTSSST